MRGRQLPPRQEAVVRISVPGTYRHYTVADVRRASAEGRFTVISTFSGGGGSSLGYRLAGGKVLAASEFVPEAARTYKANFPECHIDHRDIRELSASSQAVEEFLARIGLRPGEPDISEASPPCSEFSVAGTGLSDQSKSKSYSDVRQNNIATLAFDYAEFVALVRPKVAVIENVPALATRAPEIIQGILHALRFPSMGKEGRQYFANWSVLSADEFGVPQKRRRLFIIAVRRT